MLETIDRVAEARVKRIPTGEFNRFIQADHRRASARESGPASSAHSVRDAEAASSPPTFMLFTNVATEFHFSVRTLPDESHPRGVRPHRDAHPVTGQTTDKTVNPSSLITHRESRIPESSNPISSNPVSWKSANPPIVGSANHLRPS